MRGRDVVEPIRRAAESVGGVRDGELAVGRVGMSYRVTNHLQADPKLPLDEVHVVGCRVKSAIRAAVPSAQYMLVHMEPFAAAAEGEQAVLV